MIQVWGVVVALLGKKLHKSPTLNHLLKVLEVSGMVDLLVLTKER